MRILRTDIGWGKVSGFTLGRLFAWVAGLALLSPVLLVLGGLLTGSSGESWPHVRDYLVGSALRNTLILVAGAGLLALVLGVPAAWAISRYRFPGDRVFAVLLVLPLAVPPYIAAYLTTDVREALIPWLVEVRAQQGVEAYLRLETTLRFFWLILILASTLFPYIFLASRSVFIKSLRSLGEASRLLGAGPWRSFTRLHLPMIRPALAAGLFLVSMEVISDYGAAKHFGINTLTVTIFRTWFGLNELDTARYLAGWVLSVILLWVVVERWQRGRARFAIRLASAPPLQPARVPTALFCWIACGVPVLLGFLYPLVILLRWHYSQESDDSWISYSREVLQTLMLGLGATVSCLFFSLIFLAVARFSQSRSDRAFIGLVATAGYASPGTVMAVGVLGVAAWTREIVPSESWLGSILLSSSFFWIFFALSARYLTVSSQVIASGYTAIPVAYDQAARLLGRKLPGVFGNIHLPLLRAPLIGGAVLVFVDVSKELPLTLLLRPFDFETLGTTAYGAANQGQILSCATPSLILILLSASSLIFVEIFGWQKVKTERLSPPS